MLLAWIAACGAPPPAGPPPSAESELSVPSPRAERYVENLRFRDNAPVWNEAADWLAAHPDEALPLLVARLDARAPETVGIVKVLPRIPGREGVEALSRALFAGDELLVGHVATSLAQHPDPAALDVLVSAAGSDDRETKNAALRGLGDRGDAAGCAALVAALADADEDTRYYAARSALTLGCLDDAAKTRIAEDPSEQVRALVGAP